MNQTSERVELLVKRLRDCRVPCAAGPDYDWLHPNKTSVALVEEAADMIEALSRPTAERVAWLIEMETDCLSRGSTAYFGAHYWHPKLGFDTDIDGALHFSRKQDAEAFKREYKIGGRVCEHMWPANASLPVSADQRLLDALPRIRFYLNESSFAASFSEPGQVEMRELRDTIDAALATVEPSETDNAAS